GLHSDRDRPEEEPVKYEGDGKSPQGAFPLLHAYGYPPPTMVRIKFPYTQTTPDLICCDDEDSEYYNEIIDMEQKGLGPRSLPSHEKMLRRDNLYKYTVVVGYNTWQPEKGAGSCIFIHVWNGSGSHTAGCTAIAEEKILKLLSWLDHEKNPVQILLSRKSYMRLRDEWGLPDVTI
ncbi:MAG: hypothetical protein HOC71_10640, partial [Candidatus Latescibacteria bacterium]|nr:hypothetical protein [Candidatus Latescibacterota bacterium]